MKKISIIFTSLFLALSTMPVFALKVSGIVYDEITKGDMVEKESIPYVNVYAILSDGTRQPVANTDLNGKFTATIPDDAKLEISYVGHKPKIIENPGENLNIKLEYNSATLREPQIIPTECTEDQEKELKNTHNAAAVKWENGKCVIDTCIGERGEYQKQNNSCVKVNCNSDEKASLEKATASKWNGEKCVPTACATNYHLNNKNKCVHDKCTKPEDDWDESQQKCVQVRCSDEQKKEKHSEKEYWDGEKCVATKCDEKIYTLDTSKGECVKIDQRSDEQRQKDLEEKQKAYEDAKAKEQSTANKTLTALTTAATGIGGMQLAQGLAEQSADKDAAADMAAYIETMRCTYGEDKQVKAGPTEIELPGANDQELMNLRGQYLALAQDLKERKNALGMKPGIESETILDRATSGLYDEENIGITNGNYASLYRAQMLQSEADQKKIDDAASTSKKRVTGGAIAAGAGVVVGVVGNSLINGKLGELLKKKKDTKALEEAAKAETDALDKLKKCLQEAGVKETDKLTFSSFPPSALSVKNINCKQDLRQAKGKPAQNLFADTVDTDRVLKKLIESFGAVVAGKMIGVTLANNPTNEEKDKAKATLTEAFDATNKRINKATEKDEEGTNSSDTGALSTFTGALGGTDTNSIASRIFTNSDADSKKKI